MHSYKELKVWILAMNVVVEIYKIVEQLPAEKKFGLTSQIKRCAVSIPSNIAEGAGRNTKKEFARFLDISNGSCYELETQLILANRIFDITIDKVLQDISSIQKMTFALKKSFKL